MSVRVLIALAAAVVALGLTLSLAHVFRSNPTPYRFEGYQYTATTRLAILSITNACSSTLEFTDPVQVVFTDGWQPEWGSNCVIRSALTLGPKGQAGGYSRFLPTRRDGRWRARCGRIRSWRTLRYDFPLTQCSVGLRGLLELESPLFLAAG
jgi:hypothetical protein